MQKRESKGANAPKKSLTNVIVVATNKGPLNLPLANQVVLEESTIAICFVDPFLSASKQLADTYFSTMLNHLVKSWIHYLHLSKKHYQLGRKLDLPSSYSRVD